MFILTHPVNFPVGGNRSARRKPTTFGRVLTDSFHMRGALGSSDIEKVLTENRTRSLRGERRALWPLRHRSPTKVGWGHLPKGAFTKRGTKCRFPLRKISIGLDFFPSCIIRTAGSLFQLLILSGLADHRFKLEQLKVGTKGPLFKFVTIRCLFSPTIRESKEELFEPLSIKVYFIPLVVVQGV